MIPVIAVIPTRYDISRLLEFIPNIIHDVNDIYIMDNGLSQDNKDKLLSILSKKITITQCYGDSIYQMWNRGMDLATASYTSSSYTALLNDDIALLPDTLAILAGFLDHYGDLAAVSPDYHRKLVEGIGPLSLEYATSTFGHNGLGCFAFLIKNSLGIRIDESFKWWYGDDDLVKQILGAGMKIGKVKNLPVEHYQGTSFNYRKEELSNQIILDRLYFNQKYGEQRT